MNRKLHQRCVVLLCVALPVAAVRADPGGPSGDPYRVELNRWLANWIAVSAIVLLIPATRIFARLWKSRVGAEPVALFTGWFAIGYAAFAAMLFDWCRR